MNMKSEIRLNRFIEAQQPLYEQALLELKAGIKSGHWVWFIFPQISGLGKSETSQHFAIADIEHARQYLSHPLLGTRLKECTNAVLEHVGCDISETLPYPDNLKFQSSMTLFSAVSENDDSAFNLALEEFFNGNSCIKTLKILGHI